MHSGTWAKMADDITPLCIALRETPPLQQCTEVSHVAVDVYAGFGPENVSFKGTLKMGVGEFQLLGATLLLGAPYTRGRVQMLPSDAGIRARTPLDKLTWTCNVCGEERDDQWISVAHRKRHAGLLDGYSQVNVRYCNDNPKCLRGAPDILDKWSAAGGVR